MLRCTIILAIALGAAAGCYAPSPPAGSYLCGPAPENACPKGQHCTCGLCVHSDQQAACGFAIKAMPGMKSAVDLTSCPLSNAAFTVAEHEQFPIVIQALAADQTTPAGQFNGSVALSSGWGDVTVAGGGSTVTLQNGVGTAMVSLNREVTPPQSVRLSARSAAGATGQSDKLCVQAPAFKFSPLLVRPGATFGWASGIVAEPSVVKTAQGWRMYFMGTSAADPSSAIGVATSADGQLFTAASKPILRASDVPFAPSGLSSPTLWLSAAGPQLIFAAGQPGLGSADIGIATGTSELGPFGSATPLLLHGAQSCSYCTDSIEEPQIALDTAAPSPDGGTGSPASLLFFSGIKNRSASIGRADLDPATQKWAPQPGPILSGDIGNEAVLLSPRVYVDGSVYKMWYTFARLGDIQNFFDLCATMNNRAIAIGYATSADGLFWIRSPSNPVLRVADSPDPTASLLLVGSVVPTDGTSGSAGLSLFYTPVHDLVVGTIGICFPDGIGRATRP